MKKIISVLLMLVCITEIYSQATLSFCTSVETSGYCVFNNDKFITSPDSTTGKIYLEVKSTTVLGSKITYKIFTVNKKGEQNLSTFFEQKIQPEWTMAWMPNIFPSPGKYCVQIFNDAGKMICSKSFQLLDGK